MSACELAERAAVGGPRADPHGDPSPFSIGAIPAGKSVKELVNAFICRRLEEKTRVQISVYPSGVEIHTGKDPSNAPPKDSFRGEIDGFSDKAKRRLKQAFLTLYVPDYTLRGVTLTTHRNLAGNEYRAAVKRYAWRCKEEGWAAIIRHEVQRRGAPHSHLALWTPAGVCPAKIRDLWLQCTGESRDADARRYAVLCRELTQDEAGWVVYMAKHDAKEDEVQSAWNGKHWSIWNRGLLQERKPEQFTIDPQQHVTLLRMLRNHQRALRRRDVERLRAEYESAVAAASAGLVSVDDGKRTKVAEAERAAWVRLRRMRVRPMHRGDLLRLLSGEVVRRMCVYLGETSSLGTDNPF